MIVRKLRNKFGRLATQFERITSFLPGASGGQQNEDQNSYRYQIIKSGIISPIRTLPEFIPKPDYSTLKKRGPRSASIFINNEENIRKMRRTCALAKHVLHTAASALEPGMTTDEIDRVVHEEVLNHGAYPSTLHYKGFPKSCCTSVNNVVCHGIPDSTILQQGDIINIDITVFHLGCHGDTSDTFKIGNVDKDASDLISATHDALHGGISVCKPGAKFSDIPHAIEPLANERGFKVCRRFVGHGIGGDFHAAPNVWHCRGLLVDESKMEPGMIFTIEPILMEGCDGVKTLPDGWTTVSKDDMRSAQAEHTVLVTPNGHEILTL